MAIRTLLLDAAGPSAAQYIALPVGHYVLSLQPWDNNGKPEASAFTSTNGVSWVSQFFIILQREDGSWAPRQEFGSSVRYCTREDAFRGFEENEWNARREGCNDVIVAAIVYILAGRQLQVGDSQGKMHIQFRPSPA